MLSALSLIVEASDVSLSGGEVVSGGGGSLTVGMITVSASSQAVVVSDAMGGSVSSQVTVTSDSDSPSVSFMVSSKGVVVSISFGSS